MRIGVAQVANGSILTEMKTEVTAASAQDESAIDGRCPDNFAIRQAFYVVEDGIAVIAGFGEFGISIGAEQNRIGAVDTDEAQLA